MLMQMSEGDPRFSERERGSQTELWRQAGTDEQRGIAES